MDPVAAKMIGAGIATIALAGAAIGIGQIFAAFVSGSFRNPEAAPRVFANVILGFALAECEEVPESGPAREDALPGFLRGSGQADD